MNPSIAGVTIPDSKIAREVTELIKDTESPLLFHHSIRVYLFGALTGIRKGLKFDPELLYIGAMFHDLGLTQAYRHSMERFEVDSANAARDFMRQHQISEAEIDLVWDAIALHTTPGIPQHKKPEVALVQAGVAMDVIGADFSEFTPEQREQVITAYPRGSHFKENIIQTFADGMKHRPESTFGTMNADILELKDRTYKRVNFCSLILESNWQE